MTTFTQKETKPFMMYKEFLQNIFMQNQLTSSFAFNKISDDNAGYRLNDRAASVGFIYRPIGETINLYSTFFGYPTDVPNTTMGQTDNGQGKNIEESKRLVQKDTRFGRRSSNQLRIFSPVYTIDRTSWSITAGGLPELTVNQRRHFLVQDRFVWICFFQKIFIERDRNHVVWRDLVIRYIQNVLLWEIVIEPRFCKITR